MKADAIAARFRVQPGAKVSLAKHFDPGDTMGHEKPENASDILEDSTDRLAEYQDRLWAEDRRALLVVLQAMDAAGKDSAIKHVMSGVNPQGCEVTSFKAPSGEELDHDYLWRSSKAVPQRGRIGIWNRSHYEEVLVVRVHPEFLAAQRLPDGLKDNGIWKRRFREINAFERYLVDNGVEIVKLFLHVSRDEQRKRFLERIERPEKNWKFSANDVKEREHWDAYMRAFEEVLEHTSTDWAPWYVVPADHKWFTRIAISGILVDKLRAMGPRYPAVGDEQKAQLLEAKQALESGA